MCETLGQKEKMRTGHNYVPCVASPSQQYRKINTLYNDLVEMQFKTTIMAKIEKRK